MPPHVPQTRRDPKQLRSRAIVDAIVGAGRELLHREGPASLTTNRIAERAGVSIGSLYRYFEDKQAILSAIYDVEAGSEIAEIRSSEQWAIHAASLREAIAMIVDFQLERHRRLLELGREFYREHHDAFALGPRLGGGELAQQMHALLARHAAEIRARDLTTAAFVLARGLSAVVRRALDEQPELLREPAFREELIALLDLYLTAERPAVR